MVERQLDFYRLTHPGSGSQWDERLQKYIYNKPSEEFLTSLPPVNSPLPKVKSNRALENILEVKSKQNPRESQTPTDPRMEMKQVIIPSIPVLFSFHSLDCLDECTRWNSELEKLLEKSIPFTFGRVWKCT